MLKFSGAEYLMMDIAARFGLDKEDWDVRLKWFHENKTKLRELVPQAEEPAQFLAAIIAYEKSLRGEPTGFTISLDCSASGTQLFSLLSGCKKTAELCNVIHTGKRVDAYTLVYQEMKRRLASNGSISRKDVKQAVMCHFYGSKEIPKKVFGEDTAELKAFYDVISELAPGANQLNEDAINIWNPEALMHEWIMPDGFHVKIKVMDTVKETVHFDGSNFDVIKQVNQPVAKSVSLSAHIAHTTDGLVVRELVGRCNYDYDHISALTKATVLGSSTTRGKDIKLMRLLELARSSMFYSVRLFNYMDADNMGLLSQQELQHMKWMMGTMLQHKPFEVITIHDAFKCLANYGNWLRIHVIDIYGQIADSELMSHIASHITKKKVQVAKLSYDLGDLVRASEYIVS